MAEAEESAPVVAFLGPEASYTHQATLDYFPTSSPRTLVPQPTIESVFTAVHAGTAQRGVVPYENSSNGSVVFTLDLLADPTNQFPELRIVGEVFLAVRHCLVGCWQSDAASKDLSRIRTLYSHPQAWTQCTRFLTTHFPTTPRQDTSSTSRAAEIVAAAGPAGIVAAIASRLAAELIGLEILAEDIQDSDDNGTRFLVLSRSPPPPPPPPPSSSPIHHKSLITFTVPHRQPGALAAALAVFATHGVNLTSLHSRPNRKAGAGPWEYVFFVEFCGRKGDGGSVDAALGELRERVEGWRWMGSWVDRLRGGAGR